MFIWLTGLVVFVIFFVAMLWDEGWCGWTFGIPTMFGVIGIMVAFIASALISCWVPQNAVGEVSRTETQLIALKDNMATDGYVGRYVYRGYIEEELQYTYLYEEKGKGVTSGHCDADKTYINYTKETEKPKLIKVEYDIVNPIWKFFSANDITGANYKVEYYLYVPEGSIVAEGQYEIDLE